MEMKKIGQKMSILMGVTLSFCLSLTGNLSSGHFSLIGFVTSFLISLVISLLIGFLVPMRRVEESLCGRLGLKDRSLGKRCFTALISDVIYTPIITVVMVTMAYKQATAHGAQMPYLPMLLKSLLLCMVIGYVLIFVFEPFFLKMLLKRSGIGGPASAPEE